MESIARRLAEKRRALENEIARMSEPPEPSGAISFGKRVGEGTSVAVERLAQVAAYEQVQAVLADVERALSKIEDGSYGTCDHCGGPIAPDRLDALPWAVACVGCAARSSAH